MSWMISVQELRVYLKKLYYPVLIDPGTQSVLGKDNWERKLGLIFGMMIIIITK
jgi:hypothetical protein